MKTTSAVGQALIRHFEQCRLTGYLCPAGVPTIGWGHTGPEVRVGMKITQSQADALFEQDLRKREAQVYHLVNVSLTQGQWDALVSFEYNLGEGNLAYITKNEKVKEEDFRGAAMEFPRWCHSGGEVLEGLVLRRKAEQQLFLTGTWSIPQ
jgi:lysozyme